MQKAGVHALDQSYLEMPTLRDPMTFKERLAWLGRMPTRWRVLFGVQSVVFMMAVNLRFSDLGRARLAVAEEEEELEKNDGQAARDASGVG